MSEIVIIGAGPTGLSAAYHLEKMGFDDFNIFEAEDTAGGLCRSIIQDGFTFDFTGHLFHVNDNYVKTFIDSVIGFENFNNIIRRSYVYSQDIYTKYPYQVNMYGLPLETIAECIEGFIKRDASEKKCKTFAEWVLQNFGRGFAKHFFYPYQEKIFCYSVNKLSASWTGKFVPKVSLKELLKGSLTDVNDAIGYNSQFYYPKKGGINFWVDKFAKKLKTEIHTSHKVDHIDMVNKVVKFSNGHEEKYKTLISTMPLDFLLKNSKQPHKSTLGKTAAKLLCNSVINVNLGVKRPQLSDKHWIYFPEKKYPFYRAGFWHNFSKHMTPDGCSSIYLELSYLKKSEKSSIIFNFFGKPIKALVSLEPIKPAPPVIKIVLSL